MDIKDFGGTPASGWPEEEKENPPLGTGEGEVPLATPKDLNVDIRTMASDLKSMAESGGGAPRSYTPAPEVSRPVVPVSPKNETPFIPPQVETSEANIAAPAALSASPKKSRKGLMVSLVILLIILAGVAAYLFYPPVRELLNGGPTTDEGQNLNENQNVPTVPLVETVPAGEPTGPSETTGEEEVNPPAEPLTHSSLFKKAADSLQETKFDPFTLEALKDSFGSGGQTNPVIVELVLKNSENQLIASRQVINTLLPVLEDNIVNSFEQDYTVFVYKNKNGTRPGLILKTKEPASSDFQNQFKTALEGSDPIILTNFYPDDPGNSAEWKSDTVGGLGNRYVLFQKNNLFSSFNYGWLNGNILIISSSYDGFKEARQRLQ